MVAVTAKKTPHGSEIAAFAKKSQQLKLEGDVLFAKSDLGGALEKYMKAQQLALRGSPEFLAIVANKAAVHLKNGSVGAAIAECDTALDASPDYKPALLRRASGYELIQQYGKAKSDLERALSSDPTDDAVKGRLDKVKRSLTQQDKAKRTGRPAGLAAGVTQQPRYTKEQIAAARQEYARQQQAAQQTMFTFDVTYQGEVKSIKLPVSLKYTTLTDAIKSEFGIDGNFAVKYKDSDGDYITITSRADFRNALTNFAAVAERDAKESNTKPESVIPVIHVEVFPSATEVVETPDHVIPTNLSEGDDQGEDVIEIDEWLLSFATLFRQALVKSMPDVVPKQGTLDLRTVGLDKCCEVLEATVGTEEADGLLNAATEKFQEAAASAIFNWGNAYACNSRRTIDACTPSSSDSTDAALAVAATTRMAELEADYEKVCERFQAALDIKSDFFEAPITWGQQAFDRGKLHHQVSKVSEGKDKTEAEKVTDEMFAFAITKYEEAMAMLPPADRDVVLTEGCEDSNGFKAQILILWGNVLYEQSQVKHSRGVGNWKEDVEAAVAKFNEAGCVKGDITQALLNHTSKEWTTQEDALKTANK